MYFRQFISLFSVLILSVFFSLTSYSKGYDISFTINGLSDVDVILAHYMNKSIYPDDTARFNKQGHGTFRGEKALNQGMYILYLPGGNYFEFIIGDDQKFSITTDTTHFVANATIDGSLENEIFFNFQNYMISKRKTLQSLQEIIKNSDNKEEKASARSGLKEINAERVSRIDSISTANPDLFVSTFLTATVDIEVPDPPLNKDGSVDSTWQYHYYKNHYFDNFDPLDGRLLYTPLYEEKVMYYLEKVAVQIPDSLIVEVDFLLDGAKNDSVLFRYLLVTLFNHYGNSSIMGLDAVQVHLAEKYYLKVAWWNDEKFVSELEERVAVLKPLILGNVCPDVELLFVPSRHFVEAANDTAMKRYPHVGELKKLHTLEGDYIVLFFWEATCSHCKKAVPKMYTIYKDELEPMGVKVVSVSTLFGEEGKEKWIDFVNKHKTYDWMNAWNPYDYQYKVKYDIRTTPQIFILDKDKKIIAKRLGPEQVVDFIKVYSSQNK